MDFVINQKSTVTIAFYPNEVPVLFKIHKGDIYYFFREIPGNRLQIKVNIPDLGKYTMNAGRIEKIEPIKIRSLSVRLPVPDRNRYKPWKIVFNPNLNKISPTPARHYTEKGIIEIGTFYNSLPYSLQQFILRHEIGHFYYKDEVNADLYAAKKFIEDGYNNSSAYYALTKVLTETPLNTRRILSLEKNLEKR